MQVLADDGMLVDVAVDGSSGAAVVLIAGFPLTREIWDVVSAQLSQRVRIVRPNLRGTGGSDVPDGPYLMERLAADLAASLDALGIERAAIAGHSLGGYVAMAFARMFTERVERLALVCSRLAADSPEQAAARLALAARVEREDSVQPAIDAYLPRLVGEQTAAEHPAIVAAVEEIAARIAPAGASGLLRGMAMRSSAYDVAPDLDVPVLVVAGRADAVIPVNEAREIAATFARGRLIVCERSGHLPMLEEPERLGEALDAWLSDEDP